MTEPSRSESPIGLAATWSARIVAVALEMVLPGLGGQWLDNRIGTAPLLTLGGFGLGMVGGVWHLLIMTRANKKNLASTNQRKQNDLPRLPEELRAKSEFDDKKRSK